MRDLNEILADCGPLAVACSGGVDSLTLAAAAHRAVHDVLVMHATSPAVPDEATSRVRALAQQEGWRLAVFDAGEFADPAYRANPVNRCFFCKTNLYGAIAARIDTGSPRQIVSGTNLDDLGEYRPGLEAARDHGVRHPYVEAGIDKQHVRALARRLGLAEAAELPAAPCLSSRVETGIRIEATTLRFVHTVEKLVASALAAPATSVASIAPRTVRCRVRAAGVVIELDGSAYDRLSETDRLALAARIDAVMPPQGHRPISFERYRTGSAFLTDAA